MKGFKEILKEVNIIVEEVLAFDIILTSVIIFLASYLGLMLINLNPWYALFPTLGYLIFLLYKDINTNKYKMVEGKYTPLYEKLRTSADNVDKENEVVDELQNDVVKDLKNVPVSSFVRIKRVSAKILGSIILCLLILFASIYNVRFGDFNFALDKVKEIIYTEGTGEGNQSGYELVAGKGGKEDDIYGEESVAKIGNQQLQIKIKQATLEIASGQIYEAPEKQFEETFPDEIFATASGGYEEKISIEDQKLVKEYFKELSKG